MLAAVLRALSAHAQPPEPAPAAPADIEHAARTRALWLVRYMRGETEPLDPEAFTPEFRENVDLARLEQKLTDLRERSGEWIVRNVHSPDGKGVRVAMRMKSDGSEWDLMLATERRVPFRISAVSLEPRPATAEPRGAFYDAWGILDIDLKGLEGESGFSGLEVLPDGSSKTLHGVRAEERMNIALASRLFVLGAIAERIAAGGEGALRWDTPVAIEARHKSVPDSRVGSLAPGSVLPLSEMARWMMAEADNSATDHLIALVGRDAIEAHIERLARLVSPDAPGAPQSSDPFLTTREFFTLKCSATREPLDRYAQAGSQERRRMLSEVLPREQIIEALVLHWRKPQRVADVGWFASPELLAVQMARLGALSRRDGMKPATESLASPGLPREFDTAPWARVLACVGAEPGSVASVWLLERKDGRLFVLALVNGFADKEPDVDRARSIIAGAAGLLAALRD